MTTAEVAEYYHRPQGTLRQWRHRGYGPQGWFALGGVVMYPRSEVERFLTQARTTSPGSRASA